MQKGITTDIKFPRPLNDFYNNKTPFLKFWKTNLPFLGFEKRNSFCQHSPALLPCNDKGNRCLTPHTDEAKHFLGLCFWWGLFWNFKKQNSFYRIRWHSPLPWQHTENTVQSGANHLIRQVSLPCEYYLSVKFCLKRSFIDYNIIKNSPSDT